MSPAAPPVPAPTDSPAPRPPTGTPSPLSLLPAPAGVAMPPPPSALSAVAADHLPLGDQRAGRLYQRDILAVAQFTPDDLAHIFGVADAMRTVVDHLGACDLLKGRVLANLFYETSTRTMSSFMAAMQRLGGAVIPIAGVQYSSVTKGESLADTVRTLECYADVIVLRHHEIGAAAKAAAAARKPVINAGDGAGEHPTQALLDLYTIRRELGRVDGLTVTLLGDLKHGRTVHSLARLLALFDVKIRYVSPPSLAMPPEMVAELRALGADQQAFENLDDVLPKTDVLYVTRVQKERFANLADYDAVKDTYAITPDVMARAKPRMALMHPLPRVNEISESVDADPRAAYFRQMECGLYVRMALLAMVLGKA